MFLRIQTSVSTMLDQQNLATMRALNAAFGASQAAAPAPAQATRAVVANKTSAVTSVTLRQQVAAAADAAANAANTNGMGQIKSLSARQLQTQMQFGAGTMRQLGVIGTFDTEASGMPNEDAPLTAIGSGVSGANAALSAAQAAYGEISDPLSQ